MEEKNNTKYSSFGVVINPKKESTDPRKELVLIQNKLMEQSFFVATIIHDKDTNEQGELKTIHLHAYIETPQKRTKKQLLCTFVDLLSINENQVSVSGDNNGYLLCQYLTHKNDSNKTRYQYQEVRTNNNELLKIKYNQKYIDPATQKLYLLADIKACRTIGELAERQGLETANKYRGLFNQIKQEQGQDIGKLITQGRQLQKLLFEIVDIVENYPSMNEQVKKFRNDIIEVFKKYGDFNFLTSL